ncbi:hypothetical protein [Rhodococcus triatomae]|nr:hypothetical protein G419_22429 [Rhodococcus triatomae BKS 15-14]
MRTTALRAIPVLGWIYVAYGLIAAANGRPLRSRVARGVWWIDVFLSVVVHAAQIPAALRSAGANRSPAATAALTMLFGMTWWRTQSGKGDVS